MRFIDYLESLNADGIDENAFLPESVSGTVVKAAAVGILVRMSQLRQSIVQDRASTTADRCLGRMLFLLASLLAVAIGAIESDSGLVTQGKRSAS